MLIFLTHFSLFSNLLFPNYPYLCHVCSRGIGNWVMVTTLLCNNGKNNSRDRKVVCVRVRQPTALQSWKLSIYLHAEHILSTQALITMITKTLEVTNSSHTHSIIQQLPFHVCIKTARREVANKVKKYFYFEGASNIV